MFPLVETPKLVRHYSSHFASVFSCAGLVEFERYISGLMVSENKTVDGPSKGHFGINRLFVYESRNQSSLNRWLSESPFDPEALNQARLGVLESLPGTRMQAWPLERPPTGVLSVDDTLLKHCGKQFEQIACLWDHVDQRYVWAHNLVTVHYSDESGPSRGHRTDYGPSKGHLPVQYQLWKPMDLNHVEQGLVAAGVKLKASKQGLKAAEPQKWRKYLLGVWQRHGPLNGHFQHQPEVVRLYDSKLRMAPRRATFAEHLLQQWVSKHPDLKLSVTFDSWYTQPGFCHYLDKTLGLAYVGT